MGAVLYPSGVLTGAVDLTGLAGACIGTRELFRVFLDSAGELSEHSANVAGTAGVDRIQRARA
ncbi:MAG: hypothetical protein JO185_02080, partial [Acidobacteriaceae bacterium]|nr:hypothetical protein [Acidobacteriaceae bacterium]